MYYVNFRKALGLIAKNALHLVFESTDERMKKYLILIIILIIYFIYSSYMLKKDVEKSILATDKIKVCGKYLGIKSIPGPTRGGPTDYITFQNTDGSISKFHHIPRYQDKLFDLNQIYANDRICYYYSLKYTVDGNKYFISQIDILRLK